MKILLGLFALVLVLNGVRLWLKRQRDTEEVSLAAAPVAMAIPSGASDGATKALNPLALSTPLGQEGEPLLVDWIWQILLPLGGQSEFVGDHGFEHLRISELLKTDDWAFGRDGYQPSEARVLLKQHYEAWQRHKGGRDYWTSHLPPVLAKNVAKWQKLLGLSQHEERLLAFAILVHADSVLNDACSFLGELNTKQSQSILALLIGCSEVDVRQALSAEGKLFDTGLVRIDPHHDYSLRSKIDVLSNQFVDLMLHQDIAPIELLKRHVTHAPQTRLTLADFHHMGDLVGVVQHHIAHALSNHSKGCNVLIYGLAGTGKTEFTRALSQALNADLFEVSWADEDGGPAGREARMSALRAAQHIFADQNVLLLFDEIEDVFDQEQKDYALNKAWLNRMLERNAVPTIWISNRVDVMDRAVLRRFDVVVEMKSPGRQQRTQMIEAVTQGFLPQEDVAQLAQHEAVVPALIERAHKVTQIVAPHFNEVEQGVVFKQLVKGTLKAQGYPSTLAKSSLSPLYNLSWLNANQDLLALSQGLAGQKRGTLCLYGPPGTGKSAYAKWLADELNLPLLYKRGSDLLSKYVGESEQLIAAAFEEAEREQAVLLFDEVDGMLQDRRQTQHSWEVTQVNELLTQMEDYKGLFIATTNLMKNLDQAALRRFDFKIELTYLKPDQAWGLFQQHAQLFALPLAGEAAKALEVSVRNMKQLTPGDFAVAMKRHRIVPFASAEAFFTVLQQECAFKEGGLRQGVGFV